MMDYAALLQAITDPATRGTFAENAAINFPAPNVPLSAAGPLPAPAQIPAPQAAPQAVAATQGVQPGAGQPAASPETAPAPGGENPQDQLMALLQAQGAGNSGVQTSQAELPTGNGPSLGSGSQAQGFGIQTANPQAQISLAQLLGG